MKYIKFIILSLTLFLVSGCNSCYETSEDAWEACNDKYNGKCRYLGDKYKVCNRY